MKRYSMLVLAVGFWGLTGCMPNLVVVEEDVAIDFQTKTVNVTVKNIGNKNAGEHLTYIEINEIGVADARKPQSQFRANVSGIAAGSSWNSGDIEFSRFSSPRGLDLSILDSANLVVDADAKNMVRESNENDNLYDANH